MNASVYPDRRVSIARLISTSAKAVLVNLVNVSISSVRLLANVTTVLMACIVKMTSTNVKDTSEIEFLAIGRIDECEVTVKFLFAGHAYTVLAWTEELAGSVNVHPSMVVKIVPSSWLVVIKSRLV